MKLVLAALCIPLCLPARVTAQEPKTKSGTLRVVSPTIPSRWAPGMALTESDRVAFDLVFESLLAPAFDSHGHRRYRAVLAERVPVGGGVERAFQLLPSAAWSSGDHVTANDVRHTLGLLQRDPGAPLAWRTLLADPQSPAPRELVATFLSGLLRPETWFTFPVVPQLYQGRELQRLDDAEFAKKPVGSGPFQVAGLHREDKHEYLLLLANPHYRAAKRVPCREIRWFASADLAADLPRLDADLVLGFDAEALAAVTRKATLGFTEKTTPRITYLALNQRHPALAQIELRRFLGLSLQPEPTVTGLVPKDSWAAAEPARLRMHPPEVAAGLAKLAAAKKPIALTCKVPNTSPEMARVIQGVIDHWHATAKAKELDLRIDLQAIAPAALADALRSRDYDIALAWEDNGDELGRLLALFDPHADAIAAGGSNFLGVQDPELYAMLLGLAKSRQFAVVREAMHNVHVHLYRTMPLIPLRQHTAAIGTGAGWTITATDPLRPFLDLLDWRKLP